MNKHGLVNQCADLWYRYYYKNYISLRYQFKVGIGIYSLDCLNNRKKYLEIDIGSFNIVIFL